jgi:hypothetical protein
MAHKIRATMGLRDENYEFDGVVNDDAFFKTHSDEEDKDEPTKRGRGSQRQTGVLVMQRLILRLEDPRKTSDMLKWSLYLTVPLKQ